MTLIYTLGGAVLLMVAGDALVRGAIALSLRFGLSPTLISLTVVALGTSAPELFISVQAALDGSPDIALGNVVGSNIANVLLVVGLPAVVLAFGRQGHEIRRSFGLMMLATLVFTGFAFTGEIGRTKGMLLLVMLVIFLAYSIRTAGKESAGLDDIEVDAEKPVWKVVLLVLAGAIGLPIGAHFLIEGARAIALSFGLSEAAIGLTVVALGTSLPELAASVAAAWRGRGEVALGNVIGSNMLNLLAVLGATAAISPLSVSRSMQSVDIPIMVVTSLMLAPFLIWDLRLGRRAGSAFVLMYVMFVALALGDASI